MWAFQDPPGSTCSHDCCHAILSATAIILSHQPRQVVLLPSYNAQALCDKEAIDLYYLTLAPLLPPHALADTALQLLNSREPRRRIVASWGS